MAVSPTKEYVVPFGDTIFKGITGQNPGDLSGGSNTNIFNTGDNQGNPYQSTTNAWNAQRLGYGVISAPDVLNAASQEAQNRYLGDPNNGGQGGWDARWNQWNGTDVTGPDGRTLLSPVHQTGLRVGQDYGARNSDGSLIGPAGSDIYKGFTWNQNTLARNPYLDPTNQLAGYNAAMAQSPFAAADPAQYLSAVNPADGRRGMAAIANNGAEAIHGLGRDANFDQYGTRGVADITGLNAQNDFDRYGIRGIQQTNDLNTANLNRLTKNIDTQSQQTLANQLPQVQQAMEAAGLGRSGAGQLALMQNQNQILEQANRDKQATLADFTNQNANRGAAAINLATQQGYGGQGQEYGQLAGAMANRAQMGFQGAGQTFGANTGAVNLATQLGGQAQGQFSGLQGNAVLQGLSDRNAANMVGRQGASQLWQQGMQNENQRYLGDSSNYLQALQAGGQYQLGTLDAERQGQSAALNDWLGLQNNRNQTQASSMQQALTLADQQRGIQQDRMNQMIAAGYLPFDTSVRFATGTTAPSAPPNAPPSFFQQNGGALIGAGLNAASNFWGQQPPAQPLNLGP